MYEKGNRFSLTSLAWISIYSASNMSSVFLIIYAAKMCSEPIHNLHMEYCSHRCHAIFIISHLTKCRLSILICECMRLTPCPSVRPVLCCLRSQSHFIRSHWLIEKGLQARPATAKECKTICLYRSPIQFNLTSIYWKLVKFGHPKLFHSNE